MKNRGRIFLGLVSILFILTSCGSNPKDEFVKYIETQQSRTESNSEFKVAIKNIELKESDDSTSNPMVNMMVTQMKNMTVEGTVESKSKGPEFSINMNIKALGMEMPVNMIGNFNDKPELYLATDILEYIMKVIGTMTGEEVSNSVDYSKLNGKYLELFSVDNTLEDQVEIEEIIKEIETFEKNQTKLNKQLVKYVNSLDKKKFIKKNDIISLKLSKKDIVEFMKMSIEEEDIKDADIKEMFDGVGDLSVKIDIDSKTSKIATEWKVSVASDTTENTDIKSVTVLYEETPTDKKVDITLPKKADVLSEEEFDSLFPDESLAKEDYKLSDEEYSELKDLITENKDAFDDETIKELLSTYKTVLSEKQYNEIENILNDNE